MEFKYNENQIFPLLNLPWEIVEYLLSCFSSHNMAKIAQCSRQFKELASSAHYWQALIQKEKKKIICVTPDVADWKEIFNSAVEYDTIEEAAEFGNNETEAENEPRYKMILSPGTHKITSLLEARPNCEIMGLWDTPRAQTGPDRKTIISCVPQHAILPFNYDSIDQEMFSLKHLTFTRHADTSNAYVMLRGPCALFENCEFIGVTTALSGKTARYTVKNCRFADCSDKDETGILCREEMGQILVQDCEFSNCHFGIYFYDCNIGASTVENCLFVENYNAMCFDEATQIVVKNSKFVKDKAQGLYVENHCQVDVIGCTFESGRTAIEVSEHSKVSLIDNSINNNTDCGVKIRHLVEIQQFTGNKITNNTIGISMPIQDNPELSEESLRKNNVISGNEQDLVLKEKKKAFDALYKEGDSAETIQDNVRLALSRQLCTYSATLTEYAEQTWYECYTCDLTACQVCIKKCHEGHNVSFEAEFSLFYCDCGAGSSCQALDN